MIIGYGAKAVRGINKNLAPNSNLKMTTGERPKDGTCIKKG
jgi:hypothetical protein